MYKSIIPDLVSIETDLNSLPGFVMCQNFEFFKGINRKAKFHYVLKQVRDIKMPEEYDFRSEYYVKRKNIWYFSRKIFYWNPQFRFDFEKHEFLFNRDYLLLPISLGGIFTLGEHLSNLIDLELFLNGYYVLRGIAFTEDDRNICISAPGFNGKTSLLIQKLSEGASYIAEDYLVINPDKSLVFPTCPLAKEYFWRIRKIGKDISDLLKNKPIPEHPLTINRLISFENTQNSLNLHKKHKKVDYLLLNSLYFLNNLFVKSIIFDQHLASKILKILAESESRLTKLTEIQVNNFNFKTLTEK